MYRPSIPLAALSLVLASPISAAPIAFEAFGNDLEIKSANVLAIFFNGTALPEEDVFDERLLLNGVEVHRNPEIRIVAVGLVGITPIVAGTSWSGDFSCVGAPFVVSFPPGQPPAVDGPVETCAAGPFRAVIEDDHVLFSGQTSVFANGQQWRWRPGALGFTQEATVEFSPRVESGWTAALNNQVAGPIELLDYSDTLTAAQELLGDAFATVFTRFGGRGAQYSFGCVYADLYVARSAGALVVADTRSERMYAAWSSTNGELTFAPDLDLWSEAALGALEEFRAPEY